MVTLRPATRADTARIVALNEAVVAVTSPMDDARCHHLLALADPCVVAEQDGAVIGFVLAMQSGAAYANDNFTWFSARLSSFVYIDRIVISEAGRGLGLGTRLYDHVSEIATAKGRLVMAAEMDLDPPNEGSLRFHKRHGFVALGSRVLVSGKTVSMQIKGL